MTMYNFTTPVSKEGPAGGHRLFSFYKLDKGITIVRNTNGSHAQIREYVDEEGKTYPELYRGGYLHTVNQATKERLIAGGVGVTESNFKAI
jgi:hypothetical protein